jgi:hypothetical protein
MSGAAGRVVVVRRGNTVVPNATVYDERLSYAALGLLVALLSRPQDRDIPMGYRAMVGRGLGEKATRDALRELETAGYRHLFLLAAKGRKGVKTDVVMSESPISREAAEEALNGRALPVDNSQCAADGAAHSDLRKRSVSAGPNVQHPMRRIAVRRTEPLHVSKETQGSSLRSEPGNPTAPCTAAPGAACSSCRPPAALAECEHGATHRTGCALCRAEARGPRF